MIDEQLEAAHHEAGHAAMSWWFRERLGDVFIKEARERLTGGYYWNDFAPGFIQAVPNADNDARALLAAEIQRSMMHILGGPVAECLAGGYRDRIMEWPIRFGSEYRSPRSDSSRIREIVKALRGYDNKKYQLRFQRACVAVIEEPRMWAAISAIAQRLYRTNFVTGDEAWEIFESKGAPQTTFKAFYIQSQPEPITAAVAARTSRKH